MLDLGEILRNAVSKVATVVTSLRVDITRRPYAGHGVSGATYGDAVTHTVLYEPKEKLVRRDDGSERLSIGTLTFLEPVEAHAEDRITLPDGRACVVLEVTSPPGACITEVTLGSQTTRG